MRIRKLIRKLPPKVALYFLSLLLIGIGAFAIYWPVSFLVVGGLLWLDLFITDFILLLRKGPLQDG